MSRIGNKPITVPQGVEVKVVMLPDNDDPYMLRQSPYYNNEADYLPQIQLL